MFRDMYLTWKIPFYSNRNKIYSEKRIQAYYIQEEEVMERWAKRFEKIERERQMQLIQMAQLSLS